MLGNRWCARSNVTYIGCSCVVFLFFTPSVWDGLFLWGLFCLWLCTSSTVNITGLGNWAKVIYALLEGSDEIHSLDDWGLGMWWERRLGVLNFLLIATIGALAYYWICLGASLCISVLLASVLPLFCVLPKAYWILMCLPVAWMNHVSLALLRNTGKPLIPFSFSTANIFASHWKKPESCKPSHFSQCITEDECIKWPLFWQLPQLVQKRIIGCGSPLPSFC